MPPGGGGFTRFIRQCEIHEEKGSLIFNYFWTGRLKPDGPKDQIRMRRDDKAAGFKRQANPAGGGSFLLRQAFQNCNGLERNQQAPCGLLHMNMRNKQVTLYLLDAGRAGFFPWFCLLRGRLPACPAAQGSPPNPALGCGSGRRHPSLPPGTPEGVGDARRQYRNSLATRGSPMKSQRPQVSWRWRSVIDGDGRRLITLWRSPRVDRSQSRATRR
jgi:hypothetical protein